MLTEPDAGGIALSQWLHGVTMRVAGAMHCEGFVKRRINMDIVVKALVVRKVGKLGIKIRSDTKKTEKNDKKIEKGRGKWGFFRFFSPQNS